MNYKILFTLVALLFTAGCFNKSNTSTETNQRVIHADVVALDQDILFNRFGSHDPYGMVYALKRDVVSSNGNHRRINCRQGQAAQRQAAKTVSTPRQRRRHFGSELHQSA